jgi:hypothetical protein
MGPHRTRFPRAFRNRRRRLRGCPNGGIIEPMEWTTPSYDELKMDAEIGSYQEDGEWPPIVEAQDSTAAE